MHYPMLLICKWSKCFASELYNVKTLLIFSLQLPDIAAPEQKEYKPGPIGKERSLKNRKAKDGRPSDGDGLEKGGPGGSRDRDSSSPAQDKVPELGGDIEGMITVPSVEYSSSSKVWS